jgi:Zn-dependent protease/CBS domain-containing protein
LCGIDVYLHGTFLLLLAAALVLPLLSGGGADAALSSVIFVTLAFGCIVLHELGHALMARRFGVRTRDITLYPIGGLARLERIPRDPHQELWIALAGPAVNVLIVALLALLFGVPAPDWGQDALSIASLAGRLLWANAALAVFNMVPAFPMDGGRVLRAFLAERMPYALATRIAAQVGQGLAFVFGFIGLVSNPMLLFVAFFVYVAAGEEAASVQAEVAFEGSPVRAAMMTAFSALAPHDPLSRAVEQLLAGAQYDFPVLDGQRVEGVLTRQALFAALAAEGSDALVEAVMQPAAAAVTSDTALSEAFRRMNDEELTTLPVVDDGRLVGLLTADNLGEFLMIQNALHPLTPRPPLKKRCEAIAPGT